MTKKKQSQDMTRKMIIIGVVLFILLSFSACTALIISVGSTGETSGSGDVAIVPLHGVLTTVGSPSAGTITADALEELLGELEEDRSIEAIILDINSPGGSPVASDEVGRAIRDLKGAGKPVVAVIREVGASGAYWAAANTDYIIANRMSITGSIGVSASSFGVDGLLEEWNITYRQVTGGESKESGSPFTEFEEADRAFLQEKVNLIHEYFIEEVAERRNMSVEEVRALATGEYYLGIEALEEGLIDEVGGYDEAIEYLESRGVEDPELFERDVRRSLWGELFAIDLTIEAPETQTRILAQEGR